MNWRCCYASALPGAVSAGPKSYRLAADLPTVWEAFQRGEIDAEQVRVIDRVARRVIEFSTLAAIDGQAVDAAQTGSPKQLKVWLRLLVRFDSPRL